jgi:beta-galactosidase/beta-glucuronidase
MADVTRASACWSRWQANRAARRLASAARRLSAVLPHDVARWIASLDPDRPYWPSSPSSDTPFHDVNGQAQGDAHYWDVWHGRKPFTAYREQYPRFMSEFGFQALPPLATIRTYADEADWNMTSYIMEHHQKNASRQRADAGADDRELPHAQRLSRRWST